MKKNVASQVVGAQMIATDGSAFTGSVTVYVTGNGGTQAVGSVGAGACVHEGNGFHTYAPAQAETNYDHVAFTFIGSGAIPATVQIYPSFPQTGDAYAATGAAIPQIKQVTDKLHSMLEAAPGSPGESRFTADAVARIQTVLGIAAGNIDTQLAALSTLIGTRLAAASYTAPDNATIAAIATYVDTEVGAIKQVTDRLATMLTAAAGSPGEFKFTADAVQAVQAVLGVSAANVDTQLSAILTAIGTRLASASYTAPNNAAILLIKEITDRFYAMLEPASGSPGEFRFTADALFRTPSSGGSGGGLTQADVRTAVGLATANLDTQLGAIAGYIDTEVASIRTVTDRLATMLTAASGSPGEFKFTADAVQAVQVVLGVSAANLDAQIAALLTAIGTRLATSGYTAPNNAGIAAIREITDRFFAMLEPAPGSPNEFRFSADALARVQTVLGIGAGNVDAQLAAIFARAVAVEVDTQDIQARLPASLVGGRIDASLGAAQANTLTASALASDAVTEIQTGLATSAQGTAIQVVTDRLATMLTAAAGSPGEFKFTADAVQAVQAVLGIGSANVDAQLAALLAAIGTRLATAGYTAPNNAGIASIKEITDRFYAMLEPASGSPGEFRYTADALVRAPTGSGGGGGGGLSQADVRDAVGLASANLDAQLSAIAGYVDTEVAAIRVVTDRLATMLTAAAGSPGEFKFTADAVQQVQTVLGVAAANVDTQLAALSTAIGTRLAAASYTAPDNATIAAIAGYLDTEISAIKQVTDKLHSMVEAAAGSPGEFRFTADAVARIQTVLGVAAANLDAQLAALAAIASSRATQASVDAVAGYIDTEVAAIKAKTDALPADPADASDIASAFATVNATLATIDGRLDTEVPAIKAVTDAIGTMVQAAPGSPGEFRFTEDALELAPTGSGGGGGTDWTAGEREQIRHRLGIDGSATAPSATPSLATAAAVSAVAAYVDTEVPAIKAVTDALGTTLEPAAGSPGEYRFTPDALEAAPTGSGGGGSAPTASQNADAVRAELAPELGIIAKLDTLLEPSTGSPGEYRLTREAVGQGADAVLDAVRADHVRPGSVGEAIFDTDLRGRRTVVRGTVGTGSTATSIVTDAFDPAGVDANQFRGRIVVFDDDTVTAALRGQATDITASTAAALPVLTVTSLTAAPAAGDTFSVL